MSEGYILEAWADKLQHMNMRAIHDLMLAEGIKADRAVSSSCALAKFLQDKTGENVHVGIGDNENGPYAFVYREDEEPINLGNSAGVFAVVFDEGRFPELESTLRPCITSLIDQHSYWVGEGNVERISEAEGSVEG